MKEWHFAEWARNKEVWFYKIETPDGSIDKPKDRGGHNKAYRQFDDDRVHVRSRTRRKRKVKKPGRLSAKKKSEHNKHSDIIVTKKQKK
jgi:hypothetical protein